MEEDIFHYVVRPQCNDTKLLETCEAEPLLRDDQQLRPRRSLLSHPLQCPMVCSNRPGEKIVKEFRNKFWRIPRGVSFRHFFLFNRPTKIVIFFFQSSEKCMFGGNLMIFTYTRSCRGMNGSFV